LLYALWGEDEFSISEFLAGIKSGLGDQAMLSLNTTTLDAQKLSLEELKSVCETVPFMAEKRLVIIKGLLERYESKGKVAGQ